MKLQFMGFLCVLLLLSTAAAQQSKFNGNWWSSLSSGERVEFLAGYIDCYANDVGDKNNTFPESWYTYAPRITQYYEKNPTKLTREVASVLFDVRSIRPPKQLKGGEVWTGKHWFFDGQYWGQMGTAEQGSYVNGYLSCYRVHLASRPISFSKLTDVYVDQISRWYDATGTVSPKVKTKRERMAIADVLYKFADAQRK